MLDSKLDTLLVLNELKNFTKTSARLGITQPAVTTHVKLLEKQLDCTLFVRNRKAIKPTEKGEVVLKYAKRLKSLYQMLLDELKDNDESSVTRIGITKTLETTDYAEKLLKYCEADKKASLDVVANDITILKRLLISNQLDVIICEASKESANTTSYLLEDASLKKTGKKFEISYFNDYEEVGVIENIIKL